MKECKVNIMDVLVCTNRSKDYCAFLDNDNLQGGNTFGIRAILEKQQTEYLEGLANLTLSSSLGICKFAPELQKAAKAILKERSKQ